MQDRYFSDEELTAYLDGEFDFAPAAQIRLALQNDPALQARMEALTVDRSALREAVEELAPDTISIPAFVRARPRRLFVALSTVAVAAVFALGVFVGALRDTGLNGWMEYAAAYHALYSTETLAHFEQSRAGKDLELDRVTASVGKSLSVDALSVLSDIAYRRAQVLSFEGQALLQLSFLSDTGIPIALCITRSSDTDGQPLVMTRMEGMASAVWSLDGYDYLLIGGQDDALIERLAEALVETGV
ncbi:anti-sigma factor [Roseobacter sinensis]|uniref:Transmembrane anti-sigma factor n=1 Tax=Roseobacter sinensis TaxID=2931391 RepID=A0ABT3B931_9RHOB|nr:hypothetical protein [Roseobacter sp. WL0113]MCV3270076.1 hypothetical protein [Roseobacter sp. WL0113]